MPNSIEARAYRKLLELEEAILLWEGNTNTISGGSGRDFSGNGYGYNVFFFKFGYRVALGSRFSGGLSGNSGIQKT